MEELKSIGEIMNDIQGYYEKLEYLYSRANTKSKKGRLISSICDICDLCFFMLIYKDDSWLKDPFISDGIDNIYSLFYQNVEDNINILRLTSLRTLNDFKMANYPFYQKYKRCNYLPIEKIFEIVKEFYYSFDNININKFISNFSKDDLYIESFDSDLAGLAISIEALKKSIILLNNNCPHNLFFAATLAHELGHVYEINLHYNVSIKDNLSTIFIEVVSSFFEYAFLNYVKENRIINEVDNEFDLFYRAMFKDTFTTYVFCMMNERKVDGSGMTFLNDKRVMDDSEKVKERFNYYADLPNYMDKISYREPIVYFFGKLIAINLYEMYRDNPKEFMKEFDTILIEFARCGKMDAFNVDGIDNKKLLSSKVLRKELNRFIKKD